MRQILIFPFIILLFWGCEDKEALQKQQTLMIQQATEQLRKTLEEEFAQKERSFQQEFAQSRQAVEALKKELHTTQAELAKLKEQLHHKEQLLQKYNKLSTTGILVDGDTLIIDANKTESYFKSLGKSFEEKLSKLAKDLEKGVIQEKAAGIEIDETRINIDFNKTKSLIELWGKKLEEIAKDFKIEQHLQH